MVGNKVAEKETTTRSIPFSSATCKAISLSLLDHLRYTFLTFPMDASTALFARDVKNDQRKTSCSTILEDDLLASFGVPLLVVLELQRQQLL